MTNIEPSLPGSLPRLLYLWPLILNIHPDMTTLVSVVLTLQKIAIICLDFCLFGGTPHYQNGCSDSMLGDLIGFF